MDGDANTGVSFPRKIGALEPAALRIDPTCRWTVCLAAWPVAITDVNHQLNPIDSPVGHAYAQVGHFVAKPIGSNVGSQQSCGHI